MFGSLLAAANGGGSGHYALHYRKRFR